ncbi:MAG: AraC family transcriptional regulator [Verrucomicrobiae bacterium]|nr:AraC family transcriptional regulator [Verrucomicrobiae bacterium]
MKEHLLIPAPLDGLIWRVDARNISAERAHHHDELEFNLVIAGRGAYLCERRTVELTRRTLFWLFPAQQHLLIRYSPDFEMWVAVFRPRVVQRVSRNTQRAVLRELSPTGEFSRQLDEPTMRRLHLLYEEVAAAQSDPVRFNTGLAYALVTTWAAFDAANQLPVRRDVHPAVERAARLLRAAPVSLSLEQLAQQAALSPGRLSRLFRQQLGMTLTEFRNRQRLERFLALAGDTDGHSRRKLLAAALEAGFGNYAQFYRVFRRYMGARPGEISKPTARSAGR